LGADGPVREGEGSHNDQGQQQRLHNYPLLRKVNVLGDAISKSTSDCDERSAKQQARLRLNFDDHLVTAQRAMSRRAWNFRRTTGRIASGISNLWNSSARCWCARTRGAISWPRSTARAETGPAM